MLLKMFPFIFTTKTFPNVITWTKCIFLHSSKGHLQISFTKQLWIGSNHLELKKHSLIIVCCWPPMDRHDSVIHMGHSCSLLSILPPLSFSMPLNITCSLPSSCHHSTVTMKHCNFCLLETCASCLKYICMYMYCRVFGYAGLSDMTCYSMK